jgi:hypothetical protein
VVDAVTELKETHGVDKFLYLDPKFPPKSAPRKNTPFREAIVFMVGGGNYVEYQNLQDYAKKVCCFFFLGFLHAASKADGWFASMMQTVQQKGAAASKKILYGATEILTASQFMQQLNTLAAKMK